MKVKVNDNVFITAGKDKGKTGKVIETVSARKGDYKVTVEGINVVTKHQKPRGERAGTVIKQEAPLSVSNVIVLCPECQKATRISYTEVDKRKLRQCRKCQKTFK